MIRQPALLFALLLISCAPAPKPAPARLPPPPIPIGGQACLAHLDAADVSYQIAEPPPAPHPCGIDTPVSVSADPLPLSHPMLMGCALADTIARWETGTVEPDARRYLGQNVIGAIPLVAYACRKEIGNGRNYMSQHGFGLALDIAGWKLADGSKVLVETDWHDSGPKGLFLHAVAADSCRVFSVVITPDVNRAHHNHFHLDIGPWRFCGPRAHPRPL